MTSKLDFSQFDGEEFEDLCEDLLKAKGFRDPQPIRSGRGPDGGRDIIVTELRHSKVTDDSRPFRWLVQCKNYAKSNKSVQRVDIGAILDKLIRHKCDGYLLLTSTVPSTDLEQDIHAIHDDQTNRYEATFWAKNRLIDEIYKHRTIYEKYFRIPGERSVKTANWQNRNPFIELYSYEESLAPYFFGRDNDIQKLIELIYRENVVLLYGESGVGKSSIIYAGLLPQLETEGIYVICVNTRSGFVTEDLLAENVIKKLSRKDDTLDIISIFSSIASNLRKDDGRLIICFDQFENIFSGPLEDQNKLGEVLSKLIDANKKFGTITFLFSLRSDFLDKLGIWLKANNISNIWNNSYPLIKLSGLQAKEVLGNVPLLVNAEFESELIDSTIMDLQELDNGDVYPVNLQIVATKLFEESRQTTPSENERMVVTSGLYKQLGGAKGIIESFINDKLQNFHDKNIAEAVLLGFVGPNGKRLSLSPEDITEKVSQQEVNVYDLLERMTQARLIKPVVPNKYELVHDFLATRLFYGLDEEQRREKNAKDAFELAFQAWESEGLYESSQKIDYFYQYRRSLNIDVKQLVFILLSSIKENEDNKSKLFRLPGLYNDGNLMLRWIEVVSNQVAINTLKYIIELYSNKKIWKSALRELVSYFAYSPSIEIQKDMIYCADNSSSDIKDTFESMYSESTIPNSIILKTMSDMCCDVSLSADKRRLLSFRILNHFEDDYRRFGRHFRISKDKEEADNQIEVLEQLMTDQSFRSVVLLYLRSGDRTTYYLVKLVEMLTKYDTEGLLEFLRDRQNQIQDEIKKGGIIRSRDVHIEDLNLILQHDKESVIELLLYIDSNSDTPPSADFIKFLVKIDDPRIDKIVLNILQGYFDKFKGGSKQWRGRYIIKPWRDAFRQALRTCALKKLTAAIPVIEQVLLRYEPDNIKSDCMMSLNKLGHQNMLGIYVKLLSDGSEQMRKKAMQKLTKQKKHYDEIVNIIVEEYRKPELPYSGRNSIKAILSEMNTQNSLQALSFYQ